MNDHEFEAMVTNIQHEVFFEAKNALGEKGFERWRHPKFCGVMTDADSQASLTGGCGDTMTMYLKVKGERLDRVSYVTDGCGSSSVAGSFAAELATGRTFDEVLDMTGEDVLRKIGTFPEAEKHCAHLAMRTLQEALNTYLIAEVKRRRSAA